MIPALPRRSRAANPETHPNIHGHPFPVPSCPTLTPPRNRLRISRNSTFTLTPPRNGLRVARSLMARSLNVYPNAIAQLAAPYSPSPCASFVLPPGSMRAHASITNQKPNDSILFAKAPRRQLPHPQKTFVFMFFHPRLPSQYF